MRASGIEEIVRPMLELFAQEAPKGMLSLSSAMAAKNLDEVRRAAHSLKSSAGNIRAKDLADLLQRLEAAADRQDEAETTRLFGAVGPAYDAVLRQLSESGIGS